MYDHQTTVALIESRFPELFETLHDPIVDGLLHLQIGEFARFAQEMIDGHDSSGWDRVTQTFNEIWKDCSPTVANALNVSFLEHLNFKDGRASRSWAYSRMPEVMRKAWDLMDAYNARIHGNSLGPD